MPVTVVAQEEFLVGTETVVMGQAPDGPLAAVFEDNGETGYFYALNKSAAGNSIQDAVHIYNVANVTDRDTPSGVEIAWSQDNLKVVLLINEFPHAVFNYSAKQGFCRTGFPPPDSGSEWSAEGHEWSDSALKLLA